MTLYEGEKLAYRFSEELKATFSGLTTLKLGPL
jgi:hypothetical protein